MRKKKEFIDLGTITSTPAIVEQLQREKLKIAADKLLNNCNDPQPIQIGFFRKKIGS